MEPLALGPSPVASFRMPGNLLAPGECVGSTAPDGILKEAAGAHRMDKVDW